MSKGTNKPGTIGLIVLMLIGLLALLAVVIFLTRAFAYLGYNALFFTDNLIAIRFLHPVVAWGIFGFFIGSIVGVLIAVKKYKLSKLLVLYPVALVALVVTILSFVNKPANYSGAYVPKENPADSTAFSAPVTTAYYKLNFDANIRSGPSVKQRRRFSLKKGVMLEVLEKGHFDEKGIEWYKISYNAREGYVSSKLLSPPYANDYKQ